MKIVIAPQGFKGTLSGTEAVGAMTTGVLRVLSDVKIVGCPVADGGHGTLETLIAATGGQAFHTDVTGPRGRNVDAKWGVLGDGVTAVVEMAQASGITRLQPDERDPMTTTTYGTGQLIRAALSTGYRRLIIGVGGSGTSDGGAGALQALGVKLTDEQSNDIPWGAEGLASLAAIDVGSIDPALRGSQLTVATDVSNPLCGPQGSAMVYGPQKGALAHQLPLLDAALRHFADVVHRDIGVALHDMPGAGAAGGLSGGLVGVLGSTLAWGADLLLDAIGLNEKLQDAGLVITGEGRIDSQTIANKAPIVVARRAKALGIPVIGIGGSLGDGHEAVLTDGMDIVEAASKPGDAIPEDASTALTLLADATERAVRKAFEVGLTVL
jgi:glycerate kinase